jgi:hypothetical protein
VSDFNDPEFATQLLSKGSYLDRPYGDPNTVCLVEVYTALVNGVAMDEWGSIMGISHMLSVYEKRREWRRKLLASLGIPEAPGDPRLEFTQVSSEVHVVTRETTFSFQDPQ